MRDHEMTSRITLGASPGTWKKADSQVGSYQNWPLLDYIWTRAIVRLKEKMELLYGKIQLFMMIYLALNAQGKTTHQYLEEK